MNIWNDDLPEPVHVVWTGHPDDEFSVIYTGCSDVKLADTMFNLLDSPATHEVALVRAKTGSVIVSRTRKEYLAKLDKRLERWVQQHMVVFHLAAAKEWMLRDSFQNWKNDELYSNE